MSDVGKTLKKAVKGIVKVVVIAAVIYGVATLAAGAMAAAGGGGAAATTGAAAGTGSMSATAGSTAAMTGAGAATAAGTGTAAATGAGVLGKIGSAWGAMDGITKAALITTGGNMIAGAAQEDPEDAFRKQMEYRRGMTVGQNVYQAPTQTVQNAPTQVAPTMQQIGPSTQQIGSQSIAQYNPQTQRFEAVQNG